MPPKKKPLREIEFATIERIHKLAGYYLGTSWHPAVARRGSTAESGYLIRIETGRTEYRTGDVGNVNVKFDYFSLTADGEVLSAPRGWAKDYKPARVTGLDEAVAKYAEPAIAETEV